MKISWSESINIDNLENIDYLFKEWYLSVVLEYEKEVNKTIELLKVNPKLGAFDNDLGLYKILIVPQIYLFYEIAKNEIHIIRIWNNFKKPYW